MNNKTDPFVDPLGFTKGTELILSTAGLSALIPACQSKNISTTLLSELTEEDIIQLGADPKQVHEIKRDLSLLRKRSHKGDLTLKERIADFPEIVRESEKHLSLLQAHAAYARLRLTQDSTDCFLNVNKLVTAAQVLQQTVNLMCKEISDVTCIISYLESQTDSEKTGSYERPYQRYSIIMSAVAALTFISLRLYYK